MDGHAWKAGLEDVIAARSAITAVDGAGGRLYYRGYEIREVAERLTFEETTFLLWFGDLPTAEAAAEFSGRLRRARGSSAPVLPALERLPLETHALDVLRTAVSLQAASDPDVRTGDVEANIRKACRLMTLIPEVLAAWHRRRRDQPPVPVRHDLGHAAHLLYLFDGQPPTDEVARALDVVLVVHADHELNASTFAARVAVATLADLHAAIVAALATLKGPRHGGANEDVLTMLREIGDAERADAFVEARLNRRGVLSRSERADPRTRMPGFGHRVYRVDDPRARVLRGLARRTAEATGRVAVAEVADRIYTAMTARTGLPVNVDFFSAVLYDALGMPPDLCTSIFAAGRVSGWCAHALEQYADNRLIRPRAHYDGPEPRPLGAVAV